MQLFSTQNVRKSHGYEECLFNLEKANMYGNYLKKLLMLNKGKTSKAFPFFKKN